MNKFSFVPGRAVRFAVASGYTVIELLVVVTITTVLLASLFAYARSGRERAALFAEHATLGATLLEAKGQALQSFGRSAPPVCGWGVYFEQNRYILYRDVRTGGDCRLGSDKRYTPGNPEEAFKVFDLSPVLLFALPQARDILFVPPDPVVYMDGCSSNPGSPPGNPQFPNGSGCAPPGPRPWNFTFVLRLADGSFSRQVRVTESGEVSF